METLTTTKPNIENYIPQRAPFIMIDALGEMNNSFAETVFTIREGHLFVNDGTFAEPGLVENMAQTAAAATGYLASLEGKPAPMGFIGALKNLSVKALPQTGDTITSRITVLHEVMNARIVQGQVFLNGEEIANCEFKIFIQSIS